MPRPRSNDPKRNAGVSLRQSEIDKITKFAEAAKLESVSAVISLLIDKYLPHAWWELEVTYSYTDADAYSVGFSVIPAIASGVA